jgi:hypothetical protein
MTTYPHRVPRQHERRPLPILLFGALIAVVAAVAAIVAVSESGDDTASGPAAPIATYVEPSAAVTAWVAAHRGEVFVGVEGPVLGDCATVPSTARGLCTILRDDLGTTRIYGVGAVASDWGTDLLLTSTVALGTTTWKVADSAAWPAPESGSFGPPWSPSTTLAEWVATEGAAVLGTGATYVVTCEAAGAIAGPDQVLVCGALTEQSPGHRTYVLGPMGATPVIEVTIAEMGDHTWWVTQTRSLA